MAAYPISEVFSICHDQLLGKGSTGNVYAGFYSHRPQQRVAIKEIDLNTIDNQVTKYLLSCEIAALSNLGKLENTGHENIVKLVEIVMHQNIIYLVMELLQGGTLADRIKQHPKGMPDQQAMTIFSQVLQGYQRIKDKQIIHRDLKPDNILFRQEGGNVIAIIDFGYCTMEEVPNRPKVYYNVGSPKYMSPEAYKQNHYSEKSDIWAIGVMLYEMLMGYTCDKGLSMETYLEVLQRKGIPLPNKLTELQQRLLAKMLQFNHNKRATCEHLLEELRNHESNNKKQERKIENLEIRKLAVSSPQQIVNDQGNQQMVPPPHFSQQVHLNSNVSYPQHEQIPPAAVQLKKQNSLVHLRSTINQADLVAMRANNRNQTVFHSLVLPNQLPLFKVERGSVDERQFRSQSKVEPNQNNPREVNPRILSFHFQNEKQKEQTQNLERIENVNLNSVRQIVHRRQQEIKPNQNFQPFIKQPPILLPPQELRHHFLNAQSAQEFYNQKNMIRNHQQPLQHPSQRIQPQIKSAHLIVNGIPKQPEFEQKLLNQNFTPKAANLQMSIIRPPPPQPFQQVLNQHPQQRIQRPDFKKSPSKVPMMINYNPQQQNQMVPEQNQPRKIPTTQPEIRPRIINQDLTATRLPQEQRTFHSQRAINPQPRNLQESLHPQSPQLIHIKPDTPLSKNIENRVNFPQTTFVGPHQEMRIMPQHIHPSMAMTRHVVMK